MCFFIISSFNILKPYGNRPLNPMEMTSHYIIANVIIVSTVAAMSGFDHFDHQVASSLGKRGMDRQEPAPGRYDSWMLIAVNSSG